MTSPEKAGRLAATFLLGLAAVVAGYAFTLLYLRVLWSFTDPRWGLPFLWFIPHGIKGLHFHHDIEFFIVAPAAVRLARAGKVSKTAAFAATAFFLGMALHHWYTEGLAVVSYEP